MHLQLLIDDLHQIADCPDGENQGMHGSEPVYSSLAPEVTPKKSSPGYQKASDVGQVVGDFQLGTKARKRQLKDEKRLLAK